MSPQASERVALWAIGLIALGGLAWRWQPPALRVAGAPSAAPQPAWDAALAAARRIDINAAGVAELERLPEVGPALARRITVSAEASDEQVRTLVLADAQVKKFLDGQRVKQVIVVPKRLVNLVV